MLLIFWGLVENPLSGVIFLLALLGLSAVRYRFAPYRALGALEILVCAAYAFVWRPALLGLWLPAVGLLETKWDSLEKELLRKSFEDRSERLKLESVRVDFLKNIRNAARLAEMSERSRIAQDIHDHVGHELSGAALALQAAVKLYEKGDGRAGDFLRQASERLQSAADHLREAVHNLKPARMPGLWSLEELCDSFGYCEARFSASGDLDGTVQGELFAVCLKELLTNIARHSGASLAVIRLEGAAGHVRMTVTDNGKTKSEYKPGMGLTGVKERIRAAGGSFTVSVRDGYSAACVLPKISQYP
jgi:signal transduction histidine kinase